MPRISMLSHWLDKLQAEGCYAFTRHRVESEAGRSFVAAQSALRRLKEQGRIVSPRQGFYVIVPPEYRATGSPPASWFIDDLMHAFGRPYYVGLLSAAAIHGAAHQQPMVFQVVTDKPTREVRSGKVVIRFSTNSQVARMPVKDIQTETGTMRVATPEATAFDLVRYRAEAGHLSHVATVIMELAERMDAKALVGVAGLVRTPDVQRLGYVLDFVGERGLADPLAEWLGTRKVRTVPLNPGSPDTGDADNRWHVRSNIDLDIGL